MIQPYTADADLTLDPARLGEEPAIEVVMREAGFVLLHSDSPGTWATPQDINGIQEMTPIDLLVPDAVSGAGRRAARLKGHGRDAARKTFGLEAVIRDNDKMTIASLEPDVDQRTATIRVAGIAGLLIAKAHKVGERANESPGRLKTKDFGDIVRLMRGPIPAREIGMKLAQFATDPMCGECVQQGALYLNRLFGRPNAYGVDEAVIALAGGIPESTIRALAPAFIADMRRGMG